MTTLNNNPFCTGECDNKFCRCAKNRCEVCNEWASHNHYGRMMCAKHYDLTQTQLGMVRYIIAGLKEYES